MYERRETPGTPVLDCLCSSIIFQTRNDPMPEKNDNLLARGLESMVDEAVSIFNSFSFSRVFVQYVA